MSSLAARLRLLHPRATLLLRREILARDAVALQRNFTESLAQRRLHLHGVARALDAVSPLATLRRGFAILHDADGGIVRSVAQTHADQKLSAKLADGNIKLRVEPSS